MTMNDPMNEAGWTGRARAIPMTDELSRAAFVETAALLEEECHMSVDFIGRHLADRRGTLTLEGTGRHLSYRLKSDGGWLFLTACPLESRTMDRSLDRRRYGSRQADNTNRACSSRKRKDARLEQRAARYASRSVYSVEIFALIASLRSPTSPRTGDQQSCAIFIRSKSDRPVAPLFKG
jgi:hypothetical protein